MYHLAEDFAIWVFSLGVDEAAWVRRVELGYVLVQLPFFAMACCACFFCGRIRRDTDAVTRFIIRMHATRRRAVLFSLVYLICCLPLAGAAVIEHAAYNSARVQPAYDKAAEEGRLPKDTAPTSSNAMLPKRGHYLRIFNRYTFIIALPCAVLGQVFWWCGHGRLRRLQAG